MARVVIIGAGLGGVPCAFELRKHLGKAHHVTLIGSSPYHEFTPSNPWIAVGWRNREQTRVAMAGPLGAKGIEWIPEPVASIDAAANRLTLAGIIVRNSILLVDFIDGAVRDGFPLEEAVVRAGAIRAKPIVLTALAAMLGALFIVDDPIFQGLAVSLLFGIFVSTVLTLLVIPVLYYAYLKRKEARAERVAGVLVHE